MKHLYLIGGTMGVGKTTTCRALQQRLEGAVFLDGDWCWDAHPFVVNDDTRAMVLDNICHLLSNFLRCPAYTHVIFCWVLHEPSIAEEILARLPLEDCAVHRVFLVCTPDRLRARLAADLAAGRRTDESVIARSLARLPLYDHPHGLRLDVSDCTPGEAAERIAACAREEEKKA